MTDALTGLPNRRAIDLQARKEVARRPRNPSPLAIGLFVGRRETDPHRWRRRWLVVGGYLLLTLALFAFFHAVYVAETIPYEHWRWRMWFPSWI